MLLHHYLADSARQFGAKTAIVSGTGSTSFSDIDLMSDRLATYFQRANIRRGDRVGVLLENSLEMVVALWAVLKAGAVCIPLNHSIKSDKLAYILNDARAAGLVASGHCRLRVGEALAASARQPAVVWVGDGGDGISLHQILAETAPPPADPGLIDQDLCLLIYTSGSTGRPKGVMMTHRAIRNNAWSISTYLGNRPDDVILCALPLSFDYGLFQVLTGARIGFTVIIEKSFAYPYEILKRIEDRGVTGLPGVPTVFATLLQFAPFDGLDLSSLRYLTNTAAPLPPSHIRRLRELLPRARIFSMYGLTECTRVSYLDPARLAEKITSVGRAMPNSEAYIVDDSGRRSAPNQPGELVVRGGSLMQGYWNRPEETSRALRDGDIAGERVLFTGDIFTMDEDGDLYFVGRKDDVFKCRGEKVSPREVENVLYELEEIAEAAVIGVADPIDGMAIKACVVPVAGSRLGEADLRRHCQARLEPRLVPRFFHICRELPKTDSGKITKAALRATAAG